MTTYKGLVKDKITKQYEVVTGTYTSKKAFVEDIRRNGLSVNPSRVKTVAVYDAIIKYTDGSELAWKVCKTVEDAKNWDKMLDAHLIEEFKRLHPEYNDLSEEQQTTETVEEIREESLLSFLGCENNDELLYKFKNSNSREISELKQVFEMIAEDRVLDDEIRLKDKKTLLDFLKFKIGFQEREEFIVIFLNNYNIMTGYEVLFKGTIDKSAVYPREIAERVFKYKAKGVIFAHNHPSGNLKPSKQDISITEHMQEFLDMIDVKLLEHVIITKDGYFSFLEEGLI